MHKHCIYTVVKSMSATFCIAALLLASTTHALNIQQQAPNIIGNYYDGGTGYFILSQQPKKIKLINFFWDKCIPCIAEFPEIAIFEKKYPNILIYAIHPDAISQDDMKRFLASVTAHPHRIITLSSESAMHAVKSSYNPIEPGSSKSFVMPTSVLLSADNRVLWFKAGYNEKMIKELENAIQQNM